MGYNGSTDRMIEASGANITGGAAELYTFSGACAEAVVFINPACTDIIYGKWNSLTADCTANNPDFILSAAGIHYAKREASRTQGILVKTVSLFSTTDSIYKTDFFVKGALLD